MTVTPQMIAMNKYDTQLRDLIHVEKGIIPANLCDYLVESIEKNPLLVVSTINPPAPGLISTVVQVISIVEEFICVKSKISTAFLLKLSLIKTFGITTPFFFENIAGGRWLFGQNRAARSVI